MVAARSDAKRAASETPGSTAELPVEEEEEELDPAVPQGPCADRCVEGTYREPFGTFEDIETGEEVEATVFTLTWRRKYSVRITDYGATVVGIRTPDNKGVVKDIVFGFDDVQGYVQHREHLFGGMVGRVAGRVPYGRFSLGNAIYNLTENVETDGPVRHHQDGGFYGLQNVLWRSHIPCEGRSLVLSVVHHAEQEGFPGAVLVQLRYQITADFRLVVHARADTTQTTLIGLRQGIMFNLAGHDAGQPDFMDHVLTINADEYAVKTRRGTATGEVRPVRKTALDFRGPKRLRKQHSRTSAGYDHTLTVNPLPPGGLNMVARLEHPEVGRMLEIRSNQPCVHLYTGRRLPPWKPPKKRPPTPPSGEEEEEEDITETDASSPAKTKSAEKSSSSDSATRAAGSKAKVAEEEAVEEEEEEDPDAVKGKDGVRYGSFSGVWLAPVWFPNAIHMDRFPKCVVTPADTYEHLTVYRFFTRAKPSRYGMAGELLRQSVSRAMIEVDTRPPEPPPEAGAEQPPPQ